MKFSLATILILFSISIFAAELEKPAHNSEQREVNADEYQWETLGYECQLKGPNTNETKTIALGPFEHPVVRFKGIKEGSFVQLGLSFRDKLPWGKVTIGATRNELFKRAVGGENWGLFGLSNFSEDSGQTVDQGDTYKATDSKNNQTLTCTPVDIKPTASRQETLTHLKQVIKDSMTPPQIAFSNLENIDLDYAEAMMGMEEVFNNIGMLDREAQFEVLSQMDEALAQSKVLPQALVSAIRSRSPKQVVLTVRALDHLQQGAIDATMPSWDPQERIADIELSLNSAKKWMDQLKGEPRAQLAELYAELESLKKRPPKKPAPDPVVKYEPRLRMKST